MSQDHISNVLAERYASPAMRAIWSGEGKVRLEREYWIAVLKGQRDLGIPVPDGVIESYERVKDQVDLDSIMRRERITRHDVKARIEEFCDLAGHEHLHKGMTSRDLTENVEQLQVYRALQLTETKSIAALIRFAEARQAIARHAVHGAHAQCRRAGHDARQAHRHVRRGDAGWRIRAWSTCWTPIPRAA